MVKKERNYNIDFLRGVATICIILIHTTWWSGTMYLPSWVSNLSLLIDVPSFMFISGITFKYGNSVKKAIKNIYEQWKKWLYFLIFYSLIILIFFNSEFRVNEIFSWIVYYFPTENSLAVVNGSLWFMIMFIKVSILSTVLICSVNQFSNCDKEKNEMFKYILFILLFIFIYTSMSKSNLIIDSEVSFYSFIYILGYCLSDYKIKDKKTFLIMETINFICLYFVFKIFNLGITSIQMIKFPPFLPYLFFSLISIILFLYLKDNLKIRKTNRIVYIGKNAIYFYFSQGVSSSFLYDIYPYLVDMNIFFKFTILLIVNIGLTFVFATFLSRTYKRIDTKIKSVKLFANE